MDFRNLSEIKYYIKRNKIISRLYWKKLISIEISALLPFPHLLQPFCPLLGTITWALVGLL